MSKTDEAEEVDEIDGSKSYKSPDPLTPLPILRAFLARTLEKRNGPDRTGPGRVAGLTIRDVQEDIQRLENDPERQRLAEQIWAANHSEASGSVSYGATAGGV